MSSLRLRAAVATAGLVLAGIATASPSAAHTCGQARVHLSGSTTALGACHAPGEGVGDLCVRGDPTVAGTGAGATACFGL